MGPSRSNTSQEDEEQKKRRYKMQNKVIFIASVVTIKISVLPHTTEKKIELKN